MLIKKRVVLLMVRIWLLSGCTRNEESSQYWWGIQDHISVSVHLLPDKNGLWPLDTQTFYWARNDYTDGLDLTQLDADEYRHGTWSVKEDVLTLKFDDGEGMKGVFCEEGLLLDYDGGFLLDFCYLANTNEIDSAAAP